MYTIFYQYLSLAHFEIRRKKIHLPELLNPSIGIPKAGSSGFGSDATVINTIDNNLTIFHISVNLRTCFQNLLIPNKAPLKKGCGMFYPVCRIVHIKDPLLLIKQ